MSFCQSIIALRYVYFQVRKFDIPPEWASNQENNWSRPKFCSLPNLINPRPQNNRTPTYAIPKTLLENIHVAWAWENSEALNYDLLLHQPLKMTLRSAARPRRALTRHSTGIYISSKTPQSHLWFTSVTLFIHLVLFHSHVYLLRVTWSAKCPVNAS